MNEVAAGPGSILPSMKSFNNCIFAEVNRCPKSLNQFAKGDMMAGGPTRSKKRRSQACEGICIYRHQTGHQYEKDVRHQGNSGGGALRCATRISRHTKILTVGPLLM